MGDYEIITRAEWGAAPPERTDPFVYVEGWFIHYVGAMGLPISPTVVQSEARMRSLQRDAFNRNYSDFEYSFAVDPCGRIFEGRGWDVQSGATYHNNEHTWSVVYLGGPDTELTDEARLSLLWLTQQGALRKPLCSYVRSHSAVYATACPGDEVRQYVPFLHAHLHDPSTPKPEPIDWHAIVFYSSWQQRVKERPLELDTDPQHPKRPLDVNTLVDLLVAKEKMEPKPDGNDGVFGPRVARGVHKAKIADHSNPDKDGTHVGSVCAHWLLQA